MTSILRVSIAGLRRVLTSDDYSANPDAVQCVVSIGESRKHRVSVNFAPEDVPEDRSQLLWTPMNKKIRLEKATVDLKVDEGDRYLKIVIRKLRDNERKAKFSLITRIFRLPISDFAPSNDFSYEYFDSSNDSCWYPLRTTYRRRIVAAMDKFIRRHTDPGLQPSEICLKIGWLRFAGDDDPSMPKKASVEAHIDPVNDTDEAPIESTDFSGNPDEFFEHLTVKRRTGNFNASATLVHEFDDGQQAGEQTKTELKRREAVGLLEVVVKSASNLPRIRSLIPGRFDMDPFAVVSFGDKTFKTRFLRHSRNPVWNEHIYFNINQVNTEYPITFSIYDHDRLEKNDHVARISIKAQELLALFSQHSKDSGLSLVNNSFAEKTFDILGTEGAKICLAVNFKPYEELRMKFWRDLLEEFDFDNNGTINSVEFQALLQHCGSSMTDDEIGKMYQRLPKKDSPEATVQDVLDYLEKKTEESQNFLDINQCGRCQAKFETGQGTVAYDRDIITHLALCYETASARKVEDFLMGGFLSEAYAQRKWFTRFAARITLGKYEIGKNNGNILIKDRRTGQIVEEKMPIYIRMGIRLLYQSIAGKEVTENKAVKRLLHDLSVKQGRKFNSPKSRRQIILFIKFHGLDCNEIHWNRPPTTCILPDYSNLSQSLINENFANFNEFFYRRLKKSARPISDLQNDTLISSPADCRVNLFENITEATRLWIKGEKFAVKDFLQDPALVELLSDAAVGVFRLAPQDYHRFHHPVNSTVNGTTTIQGTY